MGYVYVKHAVDCPPENSSIQILISQREKINVNKMYSYRGEKKKKTGLEPSLLIHRLFRPTLVLIRATSEIDSPRSPLQVERERQQRLPWQLCPAGWHRRIVLALLYG